MALREMSAFYFCCIIFVVLIGSAECFNCWFYCTPSRMALCGMGGHRNWTNRNK